MVEMRGKLARMMRVVRLIVVKICLERILKSLIDLLLGGFFAGLSIAGFAGVTVAPADALLVLGARVAALLDLRRAAATKPKNFAKHGITFSYSII